jgi:hypothetical protein
MPQLDFTTLSTVLFSSLISAVVYYSFISLRLLPDVLTVLKFRTKKLSKENSLNLNLVFLPNLYSYDIIVRQNKLNQTMGVEILDEKFVANSIKSDSN